MHWNSDWSDSIAFIQVIGDLKEPEKRRRTFSLPACSPIVTHPIIISRGTGRALQPFTQTPSLSNTSQPIGLNSLYIFSFVNALPVHLFKLGIVKNSQRVLKPRSSVGRVNLLPSTEYGVQGILWYYAAVFLTTAQHPIQVLYGVQHLEVMNTFSFSNEIF